MFELQLLQVHASLQRALGCLIDLHKFCWIANLSNTQTRFGVEQPSKLKDDSHPLSRAVSGCLGCVLNLGSCGTQEVSS